MGKRSRLKRANRGVLRHWKLLLCVSIVFNLFLVWHIFNKTSTSSGKGNRVKSSSNYDKDLGNNLGSIKESKQVEVVRNEPVLNSRDGAVIGENGNELQSNGRSYQGNGPKSPIEAANPQSQAQRPKPPVNYDPVKRSKKLFPCNDYTPRKYFAQRGVFWVLYNYFIGNYYFRCDESVTFATHAEWSNLDNLIPLLERWQGPISLAIFAPGTDFEETTKRIQYFRECAGSSVYKDLVTFHLFFDENLPESNITYNPPQTKVDCVKLKESFKFGGNLPSFRKLENLTYPANVARNVAREMAHTHFVLSSEIDLYPSRNLIQDFLSMVRKNDLIRHDSSSRKVFVSPTFEVEPNVRKLPEDKKELVSLLHSRGAMPFYRFGCAYCNDLPEYDDWVDAPLEPGLKVFRVVKRQRPFHRWEPKFIGTKMDPMYDERLNLEGLDDQRTQAHVLCLMDYEFHILDNAFLVHRPRRKRREITVSFKSQIVTNQSSLIDKKISFELKQVYGNRPECDL